MTARNIISYLLLLTVLVLCLVHVADRWVIFVSLVTVGYWLENLNQIIHRQFVIIARIRGGR